MRFCVSAFILHHRQRPRSWLKLNSNSNTYTLTKHTGGYGGHELSQSWGSGLNGQLGMPGARSRRRFRARLRSAIDGAAATAASGFSSSGVSEQSQQQTQRSQQQLVFGGSEADKEEGECGCGGAQHQQNQTAAQGSVKEGGCCGTQQEVAYYGLVAQSSAGCCDGEGGLSSAVDGCYVLKTTQNTDPGGCTCTLFSLTRVCHGQSLYQQLQVCVPVCLYASVFGGTCEASNRCVCTPLLAFKSASVLCARRARKFTHSCLVG